MIKCQRTKKKDIDQLEKTFDDNDDDGDDDDDDDELYD